MAWQFSPSKPIYLQIADEIELRIFDGEYEKGMRLPSVRDLAVVAAVNPNTMQRALACLESRGLVASQRTTGRTVTEDETVITAARKSRAEQLADTFLLNMKALGYEKEMALALVAEREAKEEEHDGCNS